jgi:hypothetical protein
MQSNYDSSTHRRYKATKSFSSYDPPNLEHEAIGRVPWVKSTICVNILLSTRGLDPRVVRNNISELSRFEIIWGILQGWLQPDIQQ